MFYKTRNISACWGWSSILSAMVWWFSTFVYMETVYAVLISLCSFDAWEAEVFIKQRGNVLPSVEWNYRLSNFLSTISSIQWNSTVQAFTDSICKNKYCSSPLRTEAMKSGKLSLNNSPFHTGNSVTDFISRCVIVTVDTLRKSLSSNWWCSTDSKSHYRFICLDYWNASAPGNLSLASLQGVVLWEYLYTYTISSFIHNIRQDEL